MSSQHSRCYKTPNPQQLLPQQLLLVLVIPPVQQLLGTAAALSSGCVTAAVRLFHCQAGVSPAALPEHLWCLMRLWVWQMPMYRWRAVWHLLLHSLHPA